ncbi:MAG: TolC family protein, partial [Opitutales bacterium]
QPLNLVTPFAPAIPGASTLTPENLFLTASLGRPGLLALESESAAAQARVRQAKASRIPWFSFAQASLEHERRAYADSNQWGILLGIDFPFWERQADLQVATAELREALAYQRLARRDLRFAVTVAFREYKSASQRLADREASVTALERELAPSLVESPDGQGIDLISRFRLRLGLLEARRDLLKVRYKRQSARLALEATLGHSLEQAVPKGN